MFETLVYTDTADHESLSKLTGFQFLAHSAEATPTDEMVTRDQLLHALPEGMAAEAWQDHPPTCAYVYRDGRAYLSRGHSTGATLSGRPGNQLTVTIMTSDPYDVLPLRPAQLYSSPEWSFDRPTTQDLEPWLTPLEIANDFDVTALSALVTSQSWAADALPSILTMLEQTQADPRVRLVIRDPDQRTVMRWIALLSMFLDGQAALALTFRVYTEDPVRASADILGAHPLLSPDLTVERAASLGVNVLDLTAQRHSSVEPSESALRHARWFLGADPYDALDAIEVSRRWSRLMGSETAAHAAELATMGPSSGTFAASDLSAALTAICVLADCGSTDELDAYGDALVDVVASCTPTDPDGPLVIDRGIWAAHAAGLADLAQSLALAALEWAATRTDSAQEWVRATTAPADGALTWPSAEARSHAAALLVSVLAGAPEAALPDLFRLARALDTDAPEALIAPHVHRLAALWSTRPDLTDEAHSWVRHDDVVRALTGRVLSLLEQGDPAATNALEAGAWDWLDGQRRQLDPRRPITVWLASRALATTPAADRPALLTQVSGLVPNHAWRLFLRTPSGIDPAEVADWIRAHQGLDPALGRELERLLSTPDAASTWRRGGSAAVLDALGAVPSVASASPTLAALAQQQPAILGLFEQARQQVRAVPNPALASLAQTYRGQLDLYREWVVTAVLESADLAHALRLTEGAEQATATRLRAVVEAGLRAGTAARLVLALRLLDPALSPWHDAMKAALDAVWDDKSTKSARTAMLETVKGRLGPSLQRRLDEYIEGQSRGRLTRAVRRVTSRDKKEG